MVVLLALLVIRPPVAHAVPPPDATEWLRQAGEADETGRFADEESLATRARDALDVRDRADSLALAECSWRIARARDHRRMWGDTLAVGAARRSLAIYAALGEPNDVGAAYAYMVFCRTERMNQSMAAAVADGRRAVAVARVATDPASAVMGETLYELGSVLSAASQPDSALAALDEGLRVRLALHRPKDTLPGNIEAERGAAFEQRGDDTRAREAFAEGIRLHEELVGRDSPALTFSLGRAVSFEYRHGELQLAMEHQERIMRLLAANDASHGNELPSAQGMLAKIDLALGDYARARDLLEQALPAMESRIGVNSDPVITGKIALSTCYRALADTAGAFRLLGELRQVFERNPGLSRLRYASVLYNEADLRIERDERAVARDLALRCEAILPSRSTAERPLLVRALSLQAEVAARDHDWREFDRVSARLDSVLASTRPLNPALAELAWWERGGQEVLRSRPDSAFTWLLASERLLRDELQQSVRAFSDHQALALSGSLSASLDGLIGLAPALDDGRRGAAWDELVHWRGLVRAEISRRRPPVDAARDSVLSARHAQWTEAARRLAQLEASLAHSGRDTAGVARERALRDQADEAERRMVRQFPAARLAEDPTAIGLDSVLHALPAGAALVAFAHGSVRNDPARLLAFVARAGAPVRVLVLGRVDSLAITVDAWRAELGESDPRRRSEARCRVAGAAVRKALWDPVAALTGDAADVYVVPEAPLVGLPWGALPAGTTAYLVESAPRVHVLDAERDLVARASARSASGLLAVGGVDFDRADTLASTSAPVAMGNRGQTRAGRLGSLPPLPGSAAEARAVAEIWRAAAAGGDAVVLAGPHASEARFKSLATGRRVLHLATHGMALADAAPGAAGTRGMGGVEPITGAKQSRTRHEAAAPAPASAKPAPEAPGDDHNREIMLAFAGVNHAELHDADENEGMLTAAEVGTLDLRGTEWVVLSACHSGAGESWLREGVLGMQRAFHLAGARTVIASQWAIDDDATREWMSALYRARAAGATTAAQAMQDASRAVLAARRHAGRSTHPFYWGAFTASGD